MSLYSYKLHKDNEAPIKRTKYKEKDLRLMTTYQLREICNKEKLVKSILNPLDKEELIRLIMKYRGEKDVRLIRRHLIGGIGRIERLLERSKKVETTNNNIDYPGKITLYENLALDVYDNYRLKSSEDLEESNVLLVDNKFKVCTIFNVKKIVKDSIEKYYLVKSEFVEAMESESKHYSLLFFSVKDSELLYDTYEGDVIELDYTMKFISMPILQFQVKPLIETKMPLAIDFGTSNTTAGIYIDKEVFPGLNENLNENQEYADYEDDKVRFVKIINENKSDMEITPLIPSVVGVKHIREEKGVK